MRSNAFIMVALLPLGIGLGCASSNAGKVCEPVTSWGAPAYRCVTPVAEAPQEPLPPPPVVAPKKAEVKENQIELKEMVEFKTGSHELANTTDTVLDEVVSLMKAHAEIARIRIEGHTDSTGTREFNQKLSSRRADTVKEYLIGQGIALARLTTKGFGQDRPIADNDTDAGRAKNRRVEIHIEEKK